jgi:hypothetical protein
MDASLYTGNGSTQVVVNNAQFKPDFVWYKSRSSGTWNHGLFDSVRGTSLQLFSNTTGAEGTYSGVTAFNSNGFTVGSDNGGNENGGSMVAWQWQAGQGSTSSNTSGTITSTVSVNTTAGFSILTYTGNGTAGATIGHGLGVAPKMIIVKNRSNAGNNWPVYVSVLGNTGALFLSATAAYDVASAYWNNTSPTSSVFSVGGSAGMNGNTQTYVAYCWSEIAGFSKFGSYTGNGSTDGPFIYLGFRPKYFLIKRTDSAGFSWNVVDSSTSPYNVTPNELQPNTSSAESTGNTTYDFVSNGVKIRTTSTDKNASGGTYIYACWAENPFKNSNAR